MNAFASIILELDEVDESHLDNLEKIVGTFFRVYPRLFEYQKQQQYEVLSRLFVSLYSKGSSLQRLLSRIGTIF
jgi:hypothetical protein